MNHQPRVFLNQSAKPTRSHYVILAMSWAGWLFDFYDLMLLSSLIVFIKRDLNLSDIQSSLLIGFTLAATALGGFLFGYLADRFGRKPVLCGTILVYSLGAFLCGTAVNFWWLLIFRFVTGCGVGGEWATGQTMVGETFPARMRARYAAVMQTGAPIGVALAALVGGFVAPGLENILGPDWGWRSCFFISVLPALLVAVIRRHMPESDIWEESHRLKGQRPKSGRHLRELLLQNPRLRILFILGLILAVTDMSAYWYTYSWMPKYLYDQLHFSMAKSSLWLLVTQAGGLLGYLCFGVVADWKGRRFAYTLFSMIWAAGLLCVTWYWNTLMAIPVLTLFFMFMVGIGTGNFSGYGPIFSELFPTGVRNTAMGTAFNLARGAQFFTPLIITWVASMPWLSPHHTLGIGISIGAFFALVTGLWVWTLPETRGTVILTDELRPEN